MGKPAARLGDPTAHGGVIALGFPMVLIGGMPAARLGDMHMCPMLTPGVPPIPHVGGPITLGSPMVLIGGMPAARMGDMAVCVGPPDSIIMGCPTVMIGEGGSGSASGGGAGGGAAKSGSQKEIQIEAGSPIAEMVESAVDLFESQGAELINNAMNSLSTAAASAIAASGTALSENTESTTKDGHWIEFEFLDKVGNAISGIEYELTQPDKKESAGSLRSDGKIKRDAQDSGEGKVILKNLTNAKWSKEIAKVGEKVKLSADAEGIKNGTETIIKIYDKAINGSERLVKTLDSKVNGNKVELEVENKFDEPELANGKKIVSNGYYFEVLAEQCKARSGLLFIEDFIELELKDSEGKPLANAEFNLFLPNGKIETGKLDSNGYKKMEKIPAGKYSIKFPNLNKTKKT